jgi:hypothetical protein
LSEVFGGMQHKISGLRTTKIILTETRRILKLRPTPVLSVHGVLASIKAAQFVIEDAGKGEDDSSGPGHQLLA